MGLLGRTQDWEWALPSGAEVRATLDVRRGIESVWLAKRLVSRAAVGTKADGHVVPLPTGGPYRGEEARIRFDAAASTCTFEVGGNALPATRFPGGPRPARSMAQWAYLAVGLVVLVIVSGVVVALARRGAARVVAAEIDAEAPLSLSYSSPDGLLVAHFPTGFTAEVEKVEDQSHSAAKVVQRSTDSVVGFVAIPKPSSTNAEQLARAIGSGIGQDWMGTGTELSETSRMSGSCFGERGVIVVGRVTSGPNEARSWSCTFVHNGHGYHFFYLLPTGASAARETLLRKIVDGTDLTGEAAAPPPPPPPIVASNPFDGRTDVGPGNPGATSFSVRGIGRPAGTIVSPRPTQRPAPIAVAPRPPPPSNRPQGSRNNVVCDGTGACFGTAPPRPSPGVVVGH